MLAGQVSQLQCNKEHIFVNLLTVKLFYIRNDADQKKKKNAHCNEATTLKPYYTLKQS